MYNSLYEKARSHYEREGLLSLLKWGIPYFTYSKLSEKTLSVDSLVSYCESTGEVYVFPSREFELDNKSRRVDEALDCSSLILCEVTDAEILGRKALGVTKQDEVVFETIKTVTGDLSTLSGIPPISRLGRSFPKH